MAEKQDQSDRERILSQFKDIQLGKPSSIQEFTPFKGEDELTGLPDAWQKDLRKHFEGEAADLSGRSREIREKNGFTTKEKWADDHLREWEQLYLRAGKLDELLDTPVTLPTAASWAVWTEGVSEGKPTFDVAPTDEDLVGFDKQLKPWIMLAAMNWGGGLGILVDLLEGEPWSTFHTDPRRFKKNQPHRKIRHLAERVPQVRGAYMTDLYKLMPTPYSNQLKTIVKASEKAGSKHSAAQLSKRVFKEELEVCWQEAQKANEPLRIIAFGGQTYEALLGTSKWPDHFAAAVKAVTGKDAHEIVVQIPHYSSATSNNDKEEEKGGRIKVGVDNQLRDALSVGRKDNLEKASK